MTKNSSAGLIAAVPVPCSLGQVLRNIKWIKSTHSPISHWFHLFFTSTLGDIFISILWTQRPRLRIQVFCPEFLGKYQRLQLQADQLQSPCKFCPKRSKTRTGVRVESHQQKQRQPFSYVGSAAAGGDRARAAAGAGRSRDVSAATRKVSQSRSLPDTPRSVRRLSLQLAETAFSRCLGSVCWGVWIGSDLRPTHRPSESVAAGGGVQQGLVWRRRGTTSPGAGCAQVCSASGTPSGLEFESVVSGGLKRLNWPVWSLLGHPALYPLRFIQIEISLPHLPLAGFEDLMKKCFGSYIILVIKRGCIIKLSQ